MNKSKKKDKLKRKRSEEINGLGKEEEKKRHEGRKEGVKERRSEEWE